MSCHSTSFKISGSSSTTRIFFLGIMLLESVFPIPTFSHEVRPKVYFLFAILPGGLPTVDSKARQLRLTGLYRIFRQIQPMPVIPRGLMKSDELRAGGNERAKLRRTHRNPGPAPVNQRDAFVINLVLRQEMHKRQPRKIASAGMLFHVLISCLRIICFQGRRREFVNKQDRLDRKKAEEDKVCESF